MSLIDGMTWALVVLALGVGLFLGALLARRAVRPWGVSGSSGQAPGTASTSERPVGESAGGQDGTQLNSASGGERTVRRRPYPPPPPGPAELTSTIRASVLQVLAERLPGGWLALVLCPPSHPGRTIWHVHLAPSVALDLTDGRSIPAAPPEPSHEWAVGGGRVVGVAEGDPAPAPTSETVAIRVSSPYFSVSSAPGDGPDGRLVVTVTGAPEGTSELRAAASDARAVQAALRHAVSLAIGGRAAGAPPLLSYSPTSWRDHERVWLFAPR